MVKVKKYPRKSLYTGKIPKQRGRITMDEAETLARVIRGVPGIEEAEVVGSIASRGWSEHDIDIAVYPDGEESTYNALGDALEKFGLQMVGSNYINDDGEDVDIWVWKIGKRIIPVDIFFKEGEIMLFGDD